MIVGMPVLYTCGTALSGSTCCSASAMTSPTSAPGWCVPADTGLPGGRVEHAALRHDELDRVEEALVLRDLGIHHRRRSGRSCSPRVLPKVDHACSSGRVSLPVKSMTRRSPSTVIGDVEVDVGVAERVVVDPAVGLVGAVGPGPHLLAEAPGRRSRSSQSTDGLDRRRAVAGEQLPSRSTRRAARRRSGPAGRRCSRGAGCWPAARRARRAARRRGRSPSRPASARPRPRCRWR